MSPAAGQSDLSIRLIEIDALAPVLEAVEAQEQLLSADENAWPATLRPEILSRRRAARIALRLALLDAGATDARGTPFGIEAGGKPYLTNGPAFSLTHSGPFALVAISNTGPLGIDLECRRTTAIEPRRRALIEAAGLALAPPRDGETERLLVAWTRLEALAKAVGFGMARLLALLGITASGASSLPPETVAATAQHIATDAGLTVTALPMPPDLFGSVAAMPRLLGSAPSVLPLSRDEIERLRSA